MCLLLDTEVVQHVAQEFLHDRTDGKSQVQSDIRYPMASALELTSQQTQYRGWVYSEEDGRDDEEQEDGSCEWGDLDRSEFSGFFPVHRSGNFEVVVETGGSSDDGEGQQDPALAVDGDGEDKKLSEEPGGERDTSEGYYADQKREGEEW